MKYSILISIFLLVAFKCAMGQNIEDPISFIQWKKVVLSNDAEFTDGKMDWGLGFLIKYKNDTIACTARDFTGTTYTRGKMLYIKDFGKEMKYWRMYVSDDPTQKVVLDTLFMKDKIEKKYSIFLYSAYFLTFSLKQKNKNLIPLEPDIRKTANKDTLYIVGYDKDHNLKIVRGIVETPLNEKYSEPEIRLQTDVFLYYSNFVGAPIVDKNGKVVGLVNRAYDLYKNTKGRIINDDKEVAGAHYEYFINGTSMRSILGKDYQK
ncbi:serine protease family protein [Aquipluma nitroreducens]|nr:hypothetical protein [Aquipluma nitroreducens]